MKGRLRVWPAVVVEAELPIHGDRIIRFFLYDSLQYSCGMVQRVEVGGIIDV